MASVPRRLATILGIAMLSLVACNGDDEASSTTAAPEDTTTTEAPPTTAAPTTTTAFVSEEAVLAGNQAAWDALFAAQNPPDPNHPQIAATNTGLSRDAVTAGVASLLQQRVRYETQFESDARVTQLVAERATVVDCLTLSNEKFSIDTGESLGETAGLQSGYRIVLEPEDGVWKWSERVADETACSAS